MARALIGRTDPQSLPVSQLNQFGCSSSSPPRTGPIATAAPTAGFYPTETFTVTFYDARGASVAKSYTF